MNVMICFEVTGKQEQVRKELAAKGYMSSWKVKRGKDEATYFLPSTSLWKKGDKMSPAKAKEDLQKSAKQLNIKIIRAVALVIGKWDGVTGDQHDSKASVAESVESES